MRTASCGPSKATRPCSRWTCWVVTCRIGRPRPTRSPCRRSWPAVWPWAPTWRQPALRPAMPGPTGPLTQAMRQGQVLFVDEANRMPGKTLNVLLGAISRRALVLTEHGSREVRAAEGFMVLMAMNQGQGYLVNPIDAALADRFPVTLEFDYLEPKDEATLLRRRTGLPATVATWMVRVAQETRALRRTRQLPADMTPRG